MSERPAIRLRSVGKLYKLFASRRDHMLDVAGLGGLLRWRGVTPRMFWALRDVDLDIAHGRRLGIVGRNGAGKSTLLKIITGALSQTEGRVDVDGRVQALFEAGSGFHPEFTGYENIDASLTYQGLDNDAIRAATEDIAEFTELGEFLGQPLKTYSLGMQARLAFAVATATRPRILIVDEVLGAGDAYFASKSSERMRTLVEQSGATVLLVSHDTSAILRYCDECIWVERGRVAQRGRALDVVNVYEGFIRELEDRRLRARNRRNAERRDEAHEVDAEASVDLTVALHVDGPAGSGCDVAEISLLRDGAVQDTLHVGDVQDAVPGHGIAISLPGERWSEPRTRDGKPCRTLVVPGASRRGQGSATVVHDDTCDEGRFAIRVKYRTPDAARLSVSVLRNGDPASECVELPLAHRWRDGVIDLARLRTSATFPSRSATAGQSAAAEGRPGMLTTDTTGIIRWPSEGSLTFRRVVLLDSLGRERAVFEAGGSFNMRLELESHRTARFNLVLGASIYRADGVFVANLVSPPVALELTDGERVEAWLELSRVPLGDARYVVSLSAFDGEVTEQARYDLVARAVEFQVSGNPPLTASTVVRLDAQWRVGAEASAARLS
jgi:lipopolysaccharide transport system ATP-binding protein